jgi:hypothetical protein
MVNIHITKNNRTGSFISILTSDDDDDDVINNDKELKAIEENPYLELIQSFLDVDLHEAQIWMGGFLFSQNLMNNKDK